MKLARFDMKPIFVIGPIGELSKFCYTLLACNASKHSDVLLPLLQSRYSVMAHKLETPSQFVSLNYKYVLSKLVFTQSEHGSTD